jgi:tripartite-type tricarboxylate transporter receptor subunit TctC
MKCSFLRSKPSVGAIVLGSVAVALILAAPARAQDPVENFYKGRTIPILIAFPPGGSYDNYARLTAAHLGRYIPGHPTFVVQNKPGAGIGALRSFFDTAPRDGSLIAIFQETIGIIQLTRPEIGKWDVRKLSYLGSFANSNAAFMIRKGAPAQTLEQMTAVQTNVGCNSPLGVAYINPAIMKRLAGYKFNIICGYKGTSAFPVAMERGEIDLVSGTWETWKNIAKSSPEGLRPLLQSGLKRHKDLPDVPLMQEVLPKPDDKKVVRFLSAGSAIGRALITPPDVPADRVASLRHAFDEMIKDPAFLAQAEKVHMEIDPTPGEEIQHISNEILLTPPDIIKLAIEASK